jgi:hypothetical protein
MKKEMVATLLNSDIISLCAIFFVVINFIWMVIGMIFEKLKRPAKLDNYFGIYVGGSRTSSFISMMCGL